MRPRSPLKHSQHMILLLLALSSTATANRYENAVEFSKRIPQKIEFESIHPSWNTDASEFCFRRGSEIFQVHAATGKTRQAVPSGVLASYFQADAPTIHRAQMGKGASLICLASAGPSVQTLRISEKRVAPVQPQDDPFALVPQKASPKTASGTGHGKTQICFVNNTAKTATIEWAGTDQKRKTYATLNPGETHLQHTYAGHVFIANNKAFTATPKASVAYLNTMPKPRTTTKPTAQKWKPELKNHNLFVKNTQSGQTTPLTTNGTPSHAYSPPMRQSPNGRYLVAMRKKPGTNRYVDLIRAAPTEHLQPKTESIFYQKPGDDLDLKLPHLFDLKTGREIPIDNTLFPNPWRLTQLHWSSENDRLFMVYNERGHQTLRLLCIQAATGKTATVIEETSPTFIDYSSKLYLHHLDQTDEAIWASERSGQNHLYLVNRKNGKITPITTGNWIVRGVDHIDEQNRQIWFRVLGIHPEQDPYHIHHARINFDGSGLTQLTKGNGTHTLQFSPNRDYYIDTWSRVDHPPHHELRRASDGKKIADLGQADASNLLALHPHLPEPFATKGRDGMTDIYGVIYRPSTFDPQKEYPILEIIYAGPHDHFVPKKFATFRSPQRMAELGFIVVRIDGMGTNWRSKAFHDVCWKNLKDSGLPDRIAWLKAAAKKYPFMDLSRVGIYGGSAGGQSAMRAVLDHADFYKAAAADCGCHDNRMDKVWWNEAWMGWPVDESYAQSSNVVDAHKLGGKLLLTVGMMDRNVDPSSTMQVVEALIKAGKDFECIPFPSGGHGAGSSPYGQRRRAEFFIRHLLETHPHHSGL